MPTNIATPETTLHLTLHKAEADLPPGQALMGPPDTFARIRFEGTHLESPRAIVDLALPQRSTTDMRWAADQVLRKVRGLVNMKAATIGGDIPRDTLLTLALDLHHATKGHVTLRGHDGLCEELSCIGALEDRYRDWVNEDAVTRTSLAISKDIVNWATAYESTVKVDVLSEKELHTHGLRLLLAVGAGSKHSPSRLVIARYTPSCTSAKEHQPEGSAEPPLMLLGKGITFDTGGINIKPYESYVSMMKNDMAGSALAFSLFSGLVEAKHPHPLLLVVPTCENAVDASSMRPGTVVKSYRGHTVRIDHTDAEGRLVLADALAFAADRYQPAKIICFATLTTAALISYGPFATPVHFCDAELQARLSNAAKAMGEDLHYFPERLCHYEANRDKEADLRNTARLPGDAARGAGSRNAAHFLKHFTNTPIVHFDIFASTWNWSGEAPGCGYGATGSPLRTLWRALSSEQPHHVKPA